MIATKVIYVKQIGYSKKHKTFVFFVSIFFFFLRLTSGLTDKFTKERLRYCECDDVSQSMQEKTTILER